jgi:phosphohistidine phosphatase
VELILWRHAEAAPGDPDAARPLTGHGERQAEAVARFLSPRLPMDLRVIASPARRTQDTARALGRAAETIEALAPGCDVATLLAAAGWPDSVQPVLVVGHQPTLGEVAAMLLAGAEASWSIKKGAVWWLSNRTREGDAGVVLKVAIGPDLV